MGAVAQGVSLRPLEDAARGSRLARWDEGGWSDERR
jgi:hypothetical protein